MVIKEGGAFSPYFLVFQTGSKSVLKLGLQHLIFQVLHKNLEWLHRFALFLVEFVPSFALNLAQN